MEGAEHLRVAEGLREFRASRLVLSRAASNREAARSFCSAAEVTPVCGVPFPEIYASQFENGIGTFNSHRSL